MAYDDLETRQHLSFKQAEGASPLPTQLKRDEVSQGLAARLWELLRPELQNSVKFANGTLKFSGNWHFIMYANHIYREQRMGDEFPDPTTVIAETKSKFVKRDYVELFDFLQFVIRHKYCPDRIPMFINNILSDERSAFRVINNTFVPVGSQQEETAIKDAILSTSDVKFVGANTHLKNSVSYLSDGRFADSVRESIHAVEAVARTLEPTAKLSKALAKLETAVNLHPSMKQGFASLYGYASDEKGIRHPLLEAGDPAVDEADAMFMLGACSSFVTYLTAKVRASGIALSAKPDTN